MIGNAAQKAKYRVAMVCHPIYTKDSFIVTYLASGYVLLFLLSPVGCGFVLSYALGLASSYLVGGIMPDVYASH